MTVINNAATFHGREPAPIGPNYRGRRYMMYDREAVWGPHAQSFFFVDCHKKADGTVKSQIHTNMFQSGCLGTPLIFDVIYVSVYPVAGDDEYLESYDRFAKSQAVFKFITGAQTVFDERPMALMSVRAVEDRIFTDKITKKPCYVAIEDGKLVVHPVSPAKDCPLEGLFADKGSPRSLHVYTTDRKARRIDSTESFQAQVANPNPNRNEKEIDVYVCLEGILWSP